MKYKATVILSIKDRTNLIKNTIRTIRSAKLGKEAEILIVDASKKRNKLPCTTYVYAPGTNLAEARNIGVRSSHSDIVMFTDDDCEVDKNWIEELTSKLSDMTPCVTGRTISNPEHYNPEFEKNYDFDRGANPIIHKFRPFFNPWRIGNGNNMCFKKSIFSKVGYFDERMGAGSPTNGGEDVDMFYKILKAGYGVYYNPKAEVLHNEDIRDVKKAAFLYGKGSICHVMKHKDINSIFLFVAITLKISIESIFNPVKREFLKGWFYGLRTFWALFSSKNKA